MHDRFSCPFDKNKSWNEQDHIVLGIIMLCLPGGMILSGWQERHLKQHTILLLQCGQQGAKGSKLFIQSQETQSYKEITGRKPLQTPIYSIITLTYSRNTPRSSKQQQGNYSNSAIPLQSYPPSVTGLQHSPRSKNLHCKYFVQLQALLSNVSAHTQRKILWGIPC